VGLGLAASLFLVIGPLQTLLLPGATPPAGRLSRLGRVLREGEPKIRDLETLRSIRAVSHAPSGGAEFTGRDLAVGVALAAVGIAAASAATGWVYMGGRLVNLLTGETKPLQ